MTRENEKKCQKARKYRKKPVILVVNKVDDFKKYMADVYEFYNLGIGEPVPVSAASMLGIGDMLDEVVKHFPEEKLTEEEDDRPRIAVIGKPNVGKSSLINKLTYESISRVLEVYYAEKNVYSRIRQKSADLRRIVNTALERNQKKYQIQLKQQKDAEKREKYKLYGELINVYGYNLEEGAKELIAPNFYDDNKEIKIPLDPTKTARENSQKYFDRYGKLKRLHRRDMLSASSVWLQAFLLYCFGREPHNWRPWWGCYICEEVPLCRLVWPT